MSSRSHSRKVNFNVSETYEIIDVIGEGAYGVVAYLIPSSPFLIIVLPSIVPAVKKSRSRRSRRSTTQCSVFALYAKWNCFATSTMKMYRSLHSVLTCPDHFYPGYTETKELRYLHRSLSYPGTHGDRYASCNPHTRSFGRPLPILHLPDSKSIKSNALCQRPPQRP